MLIIFPLFVAMLLFPFVVRVMDLCGLRRCAPDAHLMQYKADALSVFAEAAPWALLAGLVLFAWRRRAAMSKDLGTEQRALTAQLGQARFWASFAAVLLFLAAVQQVAQTPEETSFWVGLLSLPMVIFLGGAPAALEYRREMKGQFNISVAAILLSLAAGAYFAGNVKEASEMLLCLVLPVTGIFTLPFAARHLGTEAGWKKLRPAVIGVVVIATVLLLGGIALTLTGSLKGD